MRTLRIGEVARAAGVGLETVRFYERRGLVPAPPRRASGYRAYPPSSVARIRFIRTAKDLGFTLKEIEELLSLRVHPVRSCAKVRRLAVEKIDDIGRRLATLSRIRRTLRRLIAACDAHEPTADCPVLGALDREA